MAITKITSTHNGKKALEYILKDRGHNGNERRNNFITGYNMVSSEAVSFHDQMEKYWNRKSEKTKIEVRRVTQSFSVNELNPDDDNDVFKAHEIGIELGKRLFPDRQFIVATQTDGKSGLVHNHIFVNNINMVTNRGMHKTEYDYRAVRRVSDEVVKSFGVDFDYGSEKSEKYSQTERAKREKAEYVWKDDLRDRIREAMDDATSRDEFIDNLEALGVECRIGKKSITYTLADTSNYESEFGEVPKQPLKSRANKLGEEFEHEHLEETFAKNQGQFTEKSQTVNEVVVPPVIEDDEDDEEEPVKVIPEEPVEAPKEEVIEPETESEPVTETESEQEPEPEPMQFDFSAEVNVPAAFTESIKEQEEIQSEVTEKVKLPAIAKMDMAEDNDKTLRKEAERKRADRIKKLNRSNEGRDSITEIYEKYLSEHPDDRQKK